MDPGKSLTTWQQAFEEYRIPTTRTIEKQLRAAAERDKEKLRALVGGSYRELLATAEAIVALEEQTKNAETRLASISHNCRPPAEAATGSLLTVAADKVTLAQSRLLQRCCTSSVTALRKQHSLQAAQMIFVSRLLLKSLSESENDAASNTALDLSKSKIAGLRRQLLRLIDAHMIDPVSTVSQLLDAVCAYCLVTSVSSDDALAHLHHLRMEKLRRRLPEARTSAALCEALRYQLSSLRIFQTLAGRSVLEAMDKLQRTPILTDPGLRTLESLDLDRIWPLLPAEIQSFVPYFKRSTSTAAEWSDKLQAWSLEACQILTAALDRHLTGIRDMEETFALRKSLYDVLLPSYFSLPGSAAVVSMVRQTLNARLGAIGRNQALQLSHITAGLLRPVDSRKAAKSLWHHDIVDPDTSVGSASFIKRVKTRHSGLTTTVAQALRSLDGWIASILSIRRQISAQGNIRWRDLMEEPDDDYEDEAIDLVKHLGTVDPDIFEQSLQESLRQALTEYKTGMADASDNAVGDSAPVEQAVFVLRAMRVSASSLGRVFPTQELLKGLDRSVPPLLQTIAHAVADRLAQTVERGEKTGRRAIDLPDNMPSPRAFSTLRHLCKIMSEIGGSDIWSEPIVHLVKQVVSQRVFDVTCQGWYVENDFDGHYLAAALGRGDDDDGSLPRIDKGTLKSAQSYWSRTKLLFGVLGG